MLSSTKIGFHLLATQPTFLFVVVKNKFALNLNVFGKHCTLFLSVVIYTRIITEPARFWSCPYYYIISCL